MADPEFHPAAAVVPVILVAYVLQCWASVQDIGILVRERTRYLAMANVAAAAVALVGYAVLVPRYLEWGAAVATVLSFATRYLLTYVYSQRLWSVRYRWKPVWIAVAWSVVVCGVAVSLPEMGLLASLALRTTMVAVYFVGLWSLPILNPVERATARGLGRALMNATLRRTR
jgi:O-antigen/teichoic acid export membrane protein